METIADIEYQIKRARDVLSGLKKTLDNERATYQTACDQYGESHPKTRKPKKDCDQAQRKYDKQVDFINALSSKMRKLKDQQARQNGQIAGSR